MLCSWRAHTLSPSGCPQGVSDACADLVQRWMNESGSAAGLLSLYDYYTDVCLVDVNSSTVAAVPSRASSGPRRRALGMGDAQPSGFDACSDDHTASFLNRAAVRAALHVSSLAPPVWTVRTS